MSEGYNEKPFNEMDFEPATELKKAVSVKRIFSPLISKVRPLSSAAILGLNAPQMYLSSLSCGIKSER